MSSSSNTTPSPTPTHVNALNILHVRVRAPLPWMASAPVLDTALSAWPHGVCMGVFMGLFGLGNHELIVLLSLREGQARALDSLTRLLPPGFEVIECQSMQATVRPHTDAPFDRAGVYVFRWFFMPEANIDEAVALSVAGWETFERQDDPDAGEGYRTEPMGLFAFRSDQSAGALLLVTWYDSMTSWERSRTPDPRATANFRQRAALTTSIVAYATRLARRA